jgi:hypothetical protein
MTINKEEQTLDTHNLDGSPGHYTEWKKNSISKGHILYDSIYITLLKWQNYSDGEEISGGQGLGRMSGGRWLWLSRVSKREIFVVME